jgi:drug/metabolite transporter (DMT)-like permease
MTLFVTASLAPALALALATGTAAPPTGRALTAAAWLGIGPMGIAFWCWSRALALGSAARIGLLSYLDPLLSTLVVAAVLGKEITRASALGMALIVVGSAGPAVLRVSTKDPRTGTT